MSTESKDSSSDKGNGGKSSVLIQALTLVLPFLFLSVLSGLRLPPWAEKLADLWGPGFVIAGGFVFLVIHYVPTGFLLNFVTAQQGIVTGLNVLSTTLTLANSELRVLTLSMQEMAVMIKNMTERIAQIESDQRWIFRRITEQIPPDYSKKGN